MRTLKIDGELDGVLLPSLIHRLDPGFLAGFTTTVSWSLHYFLFFPSNLVILFNNLVLILNHSWKSCLLIVRRQSANSLAKDWRLSKLFSYISCSVFRFGVLQFFKSWNLHHFPNFIMRFVPIWTLLVIEATFKKCRTCLEVTQK